MGEGEIVEVEGGHIVRSRGRKDRHSKVCTAKGPRDRRVRLSAHTAIQFYDVQDRLGYDRPSKALDWLITKAKPAIDQLALLPPWKPSLTTNNNNNNNPRHIQNDDVTEQFGDEKEKENFHNNNNNLSGPVLGPGPCGFLPFDTDIAETIRSFFPATTSSSSAFESYAPDLISRTSNQDLRLSLQSFQDPIQQHVLFTGTLDGMVAWNSGGDLDNNNTGSNNDSTGGGGGGGFMFHAPSPAAVAPPAVMYGQNQYVSQRGPLQSSNTPALRAWIDAPSFVDHRRAAVAPVYQSFDPLAAGAGFASGGFSGFRVPARIWGDDEEEQGGPSSASSDSRR